MIEREFLGGISMVEITTENDEQEITDDKEEDLEEQKKKIKREADELWKSVQAGDNQHLNTRVANILNRYPETRNSDITLQLRYWQVYDGLKTDSINIKELYKLERLTSITRARAKIQNEYEFFRADTKVRRQRRTKEEEEKETQLLDKPSYSTINVFSDETGKSEKYITVAGIWFLDEQKTSKVYRDFIEWSSAKEKSGVSLPEEFHFRELNNRNSDELNLYKEFFNLIIQNGEMVGFKAVTVNKTKINRIPISELIIQLYYQFIRLGVEHEINSGRVSLPRKINLTKDEDGDSELIIEMIKQELGDNFKLHYEEQLIMDQLIPMESHKSIFLQFADLFAAAINRKYNNPGNNNKDKLANHILETIGMNEIRLTANEVKNDIESIDKSDHSVLFLFD